ncbi:UNKNOWN [Stylonychia lemnae]|uniref:Uncharacterized protein n=1 Tax=Stylonychia lemnae TaxID=5949 RepID=A0A078AII1_STYLE|nr:UNKNOWN [Stylonychia lemnae]|eukprot:CDW81746.1 UNKNOWN [Stylonychia lemnae]
MNIFNLDITLKEKLHYILNTNIASIMKNKALNAFSTQQGKYLSLINSESRAITNQHKDLAIDILIEFVRKKLTKKTDSKPKYVHVRKFVQLYLHMKNQKQ